MSISLSEHLIAPARVVRGEGAWEACLPAIGALCRRPLLLGRSCATEALREGLAADLRRLGLDPLVAQLQFDCCEEDLRRLQQAVIAANAEPMAAGPIDAVLAAGGGKVMDAGKLLADRLGLPCITVPTSAATCAGWTALANLYSPAGAFIGDVSLQRSPALLVFDHRLILQAPPRTLASGLADAMAKWYEAAVSSAYSTDGLVHQAVQMARVLRDQLLLEGQEAMAQPGGDAWARVAEACGLTAGVIGGLGGARCRTVGAHAVHNGLTQLAASHGRLHGEKVGFGILVQLRLEELVGSNRLASQARRQLLGFFRQLSLPVTLAELGLAEAPLNDLQRVCSFACQPGSDLHRLPFAVSPADLLGALVSTDAAIEQPANADANR
ncbi:iron-containing alcohol dehydrogenase family protein [Synechococcus sp. ATX 2A4]|uniref:iron-containing alcohol dehydrogenase family protein n=1 Tax=Synechococcus sp. ATX 2A4 TaxID=2823727 RepID=UPI0020CEF700|nr:iron-containing alcohol dehydrogenase family protein [Synechococcus sp. ATX 2A4]MCP9883855.1 iron-containing alcohol dehydrogenase family protein [Synechococcus sp. ATX 2A4]